MQQKYQCHICMQIASRPVVTPCGHLFCWVCIYHWLRSNQQFLTCPICKSGLEMSSLRALVTPNDPPEKMENGVPPRPKAFIRQNAITSKVDSLPQSIANVGMNLQRGVLIAGYGLFPSIVVSNYSHHKQPQRQINPLGQQSIEYQIFQKLSKVKTIAICVVILLIVFII